MEEKTGVEAVFKSSENHLQEQIAVKAIGLVKPMLVDCCNEISSYLGDCEKVIMIYKHKKDAPVGILVLDTHKNFEATGGERFNFTGDSTDPKNPNRPDALIKYYTAEEFVQLLLEGKLKEITTRLL